jgi:hypothetical protein
MLAQGAPGAEEQCLHGRVRDVKRRGDLSQRAALELPHHQSGALIEGQAGQPANDIADRRRGRITD